MHAFRSKYFVRLSTKRLSDDDLGVYFQVREKTGKKHYGFVRVQAEDKLKDVMQRIEQNLDEQINTVVSQDHQSIHVNC
jgi:hypothetical protein